MKTQKKKIEAVLDPKSKLNQLAAELFSYQREDIECLSPKERMDILVKILPYLCEKQNPKEMGLSAAERQSIKEAETRVLLFNKNLK